MNRIILPLSLATSLAIGFAGGIVFKSNSDVDSDFDVSSAIELREPIAKPVRTADHLLTTASVREAKAMMEDPFSKGGKFDLMDPKKLAELEKFLREVPYSVLKQIYFERQDEQFLKLSERYDDGKGLDPAAQDARANELFERYQRYSGTESDYYAETEWKLRGGRTLPVRLFLNFYSSDVYSGGSRTEGRRWAIGIPSDARSGSDLCWSLQAYFILDGKTANGWASTCMPSTPLRGGTPYAIVQPSAKELVPYFDSLAIPIPSFGPGSSAVAEWNDGTRGTWTSLSGVRWERRFPEEIARLRASVLEN